MHGVAIWELWKVNVRQLREQHQNMKYHPIGGEFSILPSSMPQPELNTAWNLEVSTVVQIDRDPRETL